MSSSDPSSFLSKSTTRLDESDRQPKRLHFLEDVRDCPEPSAQSSYRAKLPKDIVAVFKKGKQDQELSRLADTLAARLQLDNREEIIYTAFYCSASTWDFDRYWNGWVRSQVPEWGALCDTSYAWVRRTAEEEGLWIKPKGEPEPEDGSQAADRTQTDNLPKPTVDTWCAGVIFHGRGAITHVVGEIDSYVGAKSPEMPGRTLR